MFETACVSPDGSSCWILVECNPWYNKRAAGSYWFWYIEVSSYNDALALRLNFAFLSILLKTMTWLSKYPLRLWYFFSDTANNCTLTIQLQQTCAVNFNEMLSKALCHLFKSHTCGVTCKTDRRGWKTPFFPWERRPAKVKQNSKESAHPVQWIWLPKGSHVRRMLWFDAVLIQSSQRWSWLCTKFTILWPLFNTPYVCCTCYLY